MATNYNKPFRKFASALGIKSFPLFSTIIDERGKTAKITDDGELHVAVSGELNIGDVTLDGVTIKDQNGNRAKVNPDGSQLVQLTGSLIRHEVLISTDTVILAGAMWESTLINVGDCLKFTIGVSVPSTFSTGYDIGYRKNFGNVRLDGSQTTLVTNEKYRVVTQKEDTSATHVTVRITNNDVVDRIVNRAYLFKYQG